MYCAKLFKSEKNFYSEDLIQVVEDVKHYLINSNIEWEIVTILNAESHEVVDRMEFTRDMYSNKCHFKMGGWSSYEGF